MLDRMGVLTKADELALQLLCEAYADYRAARDVLHALGSNYYETTTQTGVTMYRLHPAVSVMQEADRRLRSWLVEFGKTPSARLARANHPATSGLLSSVQTSAVCSLTREPPR